MFKLTRYFAVASLVCIVVAAAVLGAFYRQLSIDALMRMAEGRNAALTRVFGNALGPYFEPLLGRSGDAAADRRPQIEALRAKVLALMAETEVVKIKIYNTDGLTVFSTEAAQIGESKRNNAGFVAAAQGRLASELTHRDQFSAFDRVIESRDVYSSYIPFRRHGSDRIEGVFELYSDVTPFLADVRRTQWLVIAGVAGILCLLYGLLYLIVRRAEQIIAEQRAELGRSLARIEEANQLLDQRVQERTRELEETNRQLQAEIAERERADERLRLAAKAFDNTVEGVIITDAETRILAVNKAFTDVTGYTEADVLDKTPRILKSGRHDASYYAEMWQALQGEGNWVGEIWNKRKNGEFFPERLTISAVRDTAGEIRNFVGVFNDISDLKASQRRLDFLAHHDLLTGLPNRLLFNRRVVHSIARARRDGQQMALMYIDLDHFKNVNDTLGHDFGDQLLKQIADHFSAHLRENDTLARVGGDEFVVLFEDVEVPRYAGTVAEKFIACLSQPFNVSGYELFITASIGISFYPTDGEDVATLVKNADTAMYHAKMQGRNAYHFYAPEMSKYARERVHLESLLRHAIERDELALHYQPQFDLLSGRLLGAEALLRWNNGELGNVSPVRFIPIAEDIGFISTLGEWVLRTACRQVVAWEKLGFVLPRIAVNLSVKQIERGNIVSIVAAALEESRLDPARLELEVTESELMQNERALEYLDGLRAMGVELAVDDFGTGYSSLSYLRRLPVQRLKIDRSFITDVSAEPSREAIVRAVIRLAAALGLHTVAEGIETEAEAQFLRREGCEEGQGYLFGRPVPAEELFARWGGTAPDAAAGIACDESAEASAGGVPA